MARRIFDEAQPGHQCQPHELHRPGLKRTSSPVPPTRKRKIRYMPRTYCDDQAYLLWLLSQSSHRRTKLHTGFGAPTSSSCNHQLHPGILSSRRGQSLPKCVQSFLVGAAQQRLAIDAEELVIPAQSAILGDMEGEQESDCGA